MDEIVKPLRDIQMDDTEYTCLKAIVFFDPSNKKRRLRNFYLNLESDVSLWDGTRCKRSGRAGQGKRDSLPDSTVAGRLRGRSTVRKSGSVRGVAAGLAATTVSCLANDWADPASQILWSDPHRFSATGNAIRRYLNNGKSWMKMRHDKHTHLRKF